MEEDAGAAASPSARTRARPQRCDADQSEPLNRLLPPTQTNGGFSGKQQHQRDSDNYDEQRRQESEAADAGLQYPNPWVRRYEMQGLADQAAAPLTGLNLSGCIEQPGQQQQQQTCLGPKTSVAQEPATILASNNTTDLKTIARLNFVNYCQTTSLRGVPKIVKTKEPLLKYIWTVFTFAFFLGCITCLALIINQYLAYDVIHQPRTVRGVPVQFPSFTVCNTRPFSQAGINLISSRNMMLPKQYSKFVFGAAINTGHNSGVGYNDTTKEALSTIFDTKGYFENIPTGMDITQLGHTLDQTILLCETTILDKSFKRSKFCELTGTWTRTYDNKFLNCYTFTADANDTKKILTVRIMAYTNERNLTTCPDCSTFPATQVSGLRVQLHNAGNYPEVQEEGLNIRPGSLTEIRFDTKEWMMKEPPHGRCSRKVPPSMFFNHNNFTYSYQACKKKVLHELIMKECGCLDSTIPLPDTMTNTGLDYCGRIPQSQFSLNLSTEDAASSNDTRAQLGRYYNLSDSNVRTPSFVDDDEFQQFLRRISCNTRVFKAALDSATSGRAHQHCFTPCTYYTYATTISTTNWPTRAYLYEIVDDFKALKSRIDSLHSRKKMVRNSSYLDPVFDRLQQVYGPVIKTAKTDPAEAERMLRDIDYIERNFIEILINRGKSNFDIEKIEEKAVISLTSLLSQMGGLLSIWVGLTFVCIVEIVELLYNIAVTYSIHRNAIASRAAGH